jgi:hypothetical protein
VNSKLRPRLTESKKKAPSSILFESRDPFPNTRTGHVGLLSHSVLVMSSTTSSPPAATGSDDGSNDGGSGPTSSPLLFFVALGFGVVFTNLWYVRLCYLYTMIQLVNGEKGSLSASSIASDITSGTGS